MKRNEIDASKKWDLSALFINDDAFETAFLEIQKDCNAVVALKGKLTESAEQLLQALKLNEILSRKIYNIAVYAHQKSDENTKDGIYQALNSRAEALCAEIAEKTAFFLPELMAAPEDQIWNYLKETEALSKYEKYFLNMIRNKPHVRSEEIETLLAQAGEMAGGASGAFGMLLNADMTFPHVLDESGQSTPLTNSSYISLLMSGDRTLRKNAFDTYYKSYEAHINTIASLMQTEVKKNIFFSKVRGFNSAREAALFANNIPLSVPDQLIEAVNNALPVFHRYMKLRKKALGLKELHLYDIYNPIVKDVEFKITYEEAVEHVIKAVQPLGQTYVETFKKAFSENWIDVYENEGKRSGAYSSGTFDSKPYILLNHKENVDSMFTLIHELGHSMHSYLSWETQPYVYANYSIFVAEVASTTNEALLNDYLLKTLEDQEKRVYVLNHYLEQFRGTIFRQTMFAEFERDIHAYVESGGALTADYLCEHYYNLNKKYFGEDVFIDEAIKYEWARIPHMYYNFYVYQYATGFSAAIALANQVLTEGETAVKRYIEFLSSGSNAYPIEVLRKAGADMETAVPVQNALKIFEKTLIEFEKAIS